MGDTRGTIFSTSHSVTRLIENANIVKQQQSCFRIVLHQQTIVQILPE